MNGKLKRHLHKVWRAVHDGVCPKCGGRMRKVVCGPRCEHEEDCDFKVTYAELNVMRRVTGEPEVLGPSVEAFEQWRRTVVQ